MRSPARDRPGPAAVADPRVYRVSEILEEVRDGLEGAYARVVVEGEVGDLTLARSGHVYFALNDDSGEASLRAVMWRARYVQRPFDLATGRRVRCTGKLTLYPARGSFQMDVQGFVDAGAGALARSFEEVVKRLEADGLTDPARRRPLPFLPRRVGVVTSPDGAAIRDILRVLGRRFPVPVLLSPAPVQGEGAADALRRALGRVDAVPDVDVIIIGRGGGSAEDLAAFNDEDLARAVAATRVPVISAVGHEVDVAITDLVADRRAATPSEAAELAVPSREDVEARLVTASRRLAQAARSVLGRGRNVVLRLDKRLPTPERMIRDRRQRLDDLRFRIARSGPEGRIRDGRTTVDRRVERMRRILDGRVARMRAAFAARAASLDALSPLAVLSRGYAVVATPDGRVVKLASQVSAGDPVRVRLHEGRLECDVTRVEDPED